VAYALGNASSALTSLSARALSDRLARGDRRALDELFTIFGGTVLRIALSVLHDRAEAEDVLQETFLELWRSATRYQPERAALSAWVATIARSRAIDRLRVLRVRERGVEAFGLEVGPSPRTPEQHLESGRDRRRVREALKALPVEQRRVLGLAFAQGLSQREISERTSTALGTVKTRTRLASRKLAGLLADGGD
jgi:RNA polymerase sigma-70 factor (ECF subfamily)